MSGYNYVTKGYSTYTDIPSHNDGYNYGRRKPAHAYVTQVETTTVERVLTPVVADYKFSGSPSKVELLNEYVHSPKMSTGNKYGSPTTSPTKADHYQGYGPNHDSSSLIRRHGPEEVVDKYLTRGKGDAGRPTRITDPYRGYGPNHRSSSPTRRHEQEEVMDKYLTRPTRTVDPYRGYRPNHGSSSPTRHQGPEEAVEKYLSRVQDEASRPTRTNNYSGPYNNWQTAGPPPTSHPLSTTTNNINEAVNFLRESVDTKVNLGPKRGGGGVLDELSTRTEKVEPAKRYARPVFGANKAHGNTQGNAIDSREAARRYRGTFVP